MLPVQHLMHGSPGSEWRQAELCSAWGHKACAESGDYSPIPPWWCTLGSGVAGLLMTSCPGHCLQPELPMHSMLRRLHRSLRCLH